MTQIADAPVGQGLADEARRPRLGDLLLRHQLITPAELEAAVQAQRQGGKRLGQVLVEGGYLSSTDLHRVLAEHFAVPFVDLEHEPVDRMVAQVVPEPLVRIHKALPVRRVDGQLVVAFADARDVFALDDIRMVTGERIVPVMAEPAQLQAAIDRVFADADQAAADAALDAEDARVEPEELAELATVVEDAPVVRYVNALLAQAIERRASDIHLEPSSNGLRVRFRIDGALHDAADVPFGVRAGVISRLKVMGGIDIAQRRLPQDGRLSFAVSDRTVDVRVATMPTSLGESVVLRILDRSHGVLTLDELGMLPGPRQRFAEAYSIATGTILVTGPTGSGKTTTLYATLGEVNDPRRSIVTVEDPVEYRIDGVKQVQVNRAAGLTFATALRSILRADPDVVLIGEIRDHETARIAVEAALTGHLVLASIHTNDAASTPLRLAEMGIEPFLVASSLSCIVAQRLVRRLCERCREPNPIGAEDLARLHWPSELLGDESPRLYREVGCPSCHHTGFRGRVALYEVLPLSEEVERLVVAGASTREVRRQAVEEGMVTMLDCGLVQAARGEVSLSELLSVVSG